MQFLSPIWFISLAALSIPLMIYLWNIRPGKTLRVGSISLISEASKTSSRSLKLLEILLLILRCLLLALIAFFLAKPVWEKMVSASKAKGWVLIPKENFKETYTRFKPQVDSLISKGYEFHYFNKGFEKRDSTKQQADTLSKSNINYWGLAKQLEESGQGREVYIFSPNFKKHFKGSKPKVRLNLKWQTYTPADSVSRWVASAALTNDGSIRVTDGSSTPNGTVYTTTTLKSNGDPAHTVRTQSGRTSISLNGSNNAPVTVDTTTQRIAIYTDRYPLDVQYLKAALDAATAFNGNKTIIKQYSNQTIPGNQTWLFWLANKPVPAALEKTAKHVLAYADGKPTDVNSWIEPGHIALKKRIAMKENGTQSIWVDDYGDPILSYSPFRGLGGLYTHFNPAWNNLVWSDDFPAMMLKLLYQQTASQPNSDDRRILTDQQIQPDVIKAATPTSPYRASEQKDVSGYFWLLLMLVFAAERVLNFKLKQQENG
ncbi:hypothetical protein FPZ42_03800 [Mucilaginibacter achroorhodeus]|uniref:Aerotolerance regulator N-terminal domain-containing protein n=1 Tax=Mucilaginibacter achroorhodeus TaxID=2599294 RepID=A0A563UAQ3_9SPHI|nr:BatA domain-containing protein [Mucilaginibacter achroorhodeus]TWR28349.1 hypothetical protein FPZ42_03800 [Mucilaginibacter achroorhodeus]